ELLRAPVGVNAEARDALRQRLNTAYERFLRRYGPINRTLTTITNRLRKDGTPVILRRMPNFSAFRDDPDAFKVAALENYDEKNDSAFKTAIFTQEVVREPTSPKIESAADALAVSLNQLGRPDISLIAQLLTLSEDDALEALGEACWLDPAGDV